MFRTVEGRDQRADGPSTVGSSPVDRRRRSRARGPLRGTSSRVLPERGLLDRASDADGNVVGWVALSTDFVKIKAYSGKPLVTLVGLDPQGTITGARVIHHSEPILLIGIPESELHDFVDSYCGQAGDAADRRRPHQAAGCHFGRRRSRAPPSPSSRRTRPFWRSRARSACRSASSAWPTSRQGTSCRNRSRGPSSRWSIAAHSGSLTVSEKRHGRLGLLRALHGPLLRHRGRAPNRRRVDPTRRLQVLHEPARRGRASLRDARAGLVVVQGLRLRARRQSSIACASSRAYARSLFATPTTTTFPITPCRGRPEFQEGAVFVARGGCSTRVPSTTWYSSGAATTSAARSRATSVSSAPPTSCPIERLPGGRSRADLPIWQQAWLNRQVDAIILVGFLLAVAASSSRDATPPPTSKRLARLHIGAHGVQLRRDRASTCGRSPRSRRFSPGRVEHRIHEWRWELFLSEPLLFIFWIFITITTLIWGRGVFLRLGLPIRLAHERAASSRSPHKLGIRATSFRTAGTEATLPALRDPRRAGSESSSGTASSARSWRRSSLSSRPSWYPPGTQRPASGWWLLLLGLSFFMYRPFCRYVCPLGGGLALLSSFRPSGPKRRRFCSECKICTRGCEPRAIREQRQHRPARVPVVHGVRVELPRR